MCIICCGASRCLWFWLFYWIRSAGRRKRDLSRQSIYVLISFPLWCFTVCLYFPFSKPKESLIFARTALGLKAIDVGRIRIPVDLYHIGNLGRLLATNDPLYTLHWPELSVLIAKRPKSTARQKIRYIDILAWFPQQCFGVFIPDCVQNAFASGYEVKVGSQTPGNTHIGYHGICIQCRPWKCFHTAAIGCLSISSILFWLYLWISCPTYDGCGIIRWDQKHYRKKAENR